MAAGSEHFFRYNHRDYGFRSFLPLTEFLDPQRGFLVDDIVQVDVWIEIVGDAANSAAADKS